MSHILYFVNKNICQMPTHLLSGLYKICKHICVCLMCVLFIDCYPIMPSLISRSLDEFEKSWIPGVGKDTLVGRYPGWGRYPRASSRRGMILRYVVTRARTTVTRLCDTSIVRSTLLHAHRVLANFT